jgi:hypothetical protein
MTRRRAAGPKRGPKRPGTRHHQAARADPPSPTAIASPALGLSVQNERSGSPLALARRAQGAERQLM